MEIILTKDIDKVGNKNEVVKVKDGYGRNYLIPKGLAIVANAANLKRLAETQRQVDYRESKRLGEYKTMATQFEGKELLLKAKAGDNGRLFGSVGASQLVEAIKNQLGIELERRQVALEADVKELGKYTADIKLHKEVQTKLNFTVEAEKEEA